MKAMIFAAGLMALAAPAEARLQLSISVGGSTFSCFDGELSCDQSGGVNNLLTIDQTIGGAFVQLTLAQSSFGRVNELQLSSSNILNESGAPIDVKLLASDVSFVSPITGVRESSSLTFNDAVGSPASALQFWLDPNNVQGANPTNTPGTLLFTANGTPVTNPDSFEGTHFNAFLVDTPFSMTEGASLNLIAGGSITGFNQAMETSVPEPRTWVMGLLGFALLGAMAMKRARTGRYAI